MLAALARRGRDRVQDGLARLVRLDDLVDDPDGDRARQPADDLLVLGRELGLDLLALLRGGPGEGAPVQDADRGD